MTKLKCCFIPDEHQAEMASWEPRDVSVTDPVEHGRRRDRVQEMGCSNDDEIWELFDTDYMDYIHACPQHLVQMLDPDKHTEVFLAQKATS